MALEAGGADLARYTEDAAEMHGRYTKDVGKVPLESLALTLALPLALTLALTLTLLSRMRTSHCSRRIWREQSRLGLVTGLGLEFRVS